MKPPPRPKPRAGAKQTNAKSLANLRPPFPKGKSGNPGGRAKADPELISALQLGNMAMLEIVWKRAHSKDERISLTAALAWLSKTLPDAAVLEISGPGGGPVAIETMRERLALALIKKFGPPTEAPTASVPALPEKT